MRSFLILQRAAVLIAVLALSGVAAGLAIGDTAVSDGDGVTPIGNNDMAAGNVDCGVAIDKTAPVAVTRNGAYDPGTQVFKKGTTATVSVLSTSGDVSASVPSSPGNQISIPSSWDIAANGTVAGNVQATVTINSSTPGAGSGSVTFRATGINPSGATINRDDTMQVSWTTGSCAPANTAPSTPGAPVLANGSSTPNQGVFDLSWTASTDDGLPSNSLTYQLQHKDANDAGYSDVSGATALSTNAFSFAGPPTEAEGTWTYKVRASDGALQSAYSDASSEIKVDMSEPTAPTASTTPSSPAYGDWFKDSVKVSYGGSTDPGLADGSAASGVASYSADQTFNTSGSHNYSGKATDNAGNESSAATGTVKVDTDNPTVTVTGCPTSAVVLGSSHTVDVSASDGSESGVDPSNDPSGTNISLPTGTIGHHTETYNAKDNVGHDGSGSCSYDVVYDWHGFFSPVDNPSTLNVAKAGSAIPVKFSLSGNQGLSILASGYPKSTVMPCDNSADLDAIESTVTAGGSSLNYDSTVDQYIYVWKTDKAWAGTCRQLEVKLADGTSHRANFKLTK